MRGRERDGSPGLLWWLVPGWCVSGVLPAAFCLSGGGGDRLHDPALSGEEAERGAPRGQGGRGKR